jgi:hypothetical protein
MLKVCGSLVAACLLFGVACGEDADGYDTAEPGDGCFECRLED